MITFSKKKILVVYGLSDSTWQLRWPSYCKQISTLRPEQNGHHFADNIFKCASLNEKFGVFIHISLKFVLLGLIVNNSALVQIMAKQAPSNYLNQCWRDAWCHMGLLGHNELMNSFTKNKQVSQSQTPHSSTQTTWTLSWCIKQQPVSQNNSQAQKLQIW